MFPVEVHVFGVTDSLFGLRVYVRAAVRFFRPPMIVFVDDFLRIFGSDLGIERIVRNDLYDGALFAEAEAATVMTSTLSVIPFLSNGF